MQKILPSSHLTCLSASEASYTLRKHLKHTVANVAHGGFSASVVQQYHCVPPFLLILFIHYMHFLPYNSLIVIFIHAPRTVNPGTLTFSNGRQQSSEERPDGVVIAKQLLTSTVSLGFLMGKTGMLYSIQFLW